MILMLKGKHNFLKFFMIIRLHDSLNFVVIVAPDLEIFSARCAQVPLALTE